MTDLPRVYLDNAATTFPKPEAVYKATDFYARELGTAFGRGNYAQARETQQRIDQARAGAASLLSAEDAKQIIFTFSGTDSLNLVIKGSLSPGDHVVTTAIEHNSVLRPLYGLEKKGMIEITCVKCDSAGMVDPEDIRHAIRQNTNLIAVNHVSNVTGAIQPVCDIGSLARDNEIPFLMDGAQSVGSFSVSVKDIPCDYLAVPGHKGLLGPLGTGILYIRPGREVGLKSLREGGTGLFSGDVQQPDVLPEKYESGNHNVPGLVGLEAAIAFLSTQDIGQVRAHEDNLADQLREAVAELPHGKVYGPTDSSARLSIVSINIDGYEPHELASILDQHYGIQVRAGMHCAARIHACIGSEPYGGTVRFSCGPFNTQKDIDWTIKALEEIDAAAIR